MVMTDTHIDYFHLWIFRVQIIITF